MNAKNKFKSEVVKHAVLNGIAHPVAVGARVEVLVDEDGQTHFGAKVGPLSFGGRGDGSTFSFWPTATNDGSIEATAHITHVR